VFLSNALLTSDNSNVDRIQLFADLIVPAIFSSFSSANLDLHENIVRLLTSLLQTTYGHQLLTSDHRGALEAALVTREQYLTGTVNDESLADEEAAHNRDLLNSLRGLVNDPVSVRYPLTAPSNSSPTSPAATANIVSVVPNSDDLQKASVAAAPTSMLMLGPPSSSTTAPATH